MMERSAHRAALVFPRFFLSVSAFQARYFFRLGNNAPAASRAHAANPASPLKGLAAVVENQAFLFNRNAAARAKANPLTPASPTYVDSAATVPRIDVSGPKVYGLPYRRSTRRLRLRGAGRLLNGLGKR